MAKFEVSEEQTGRFEGLYANNPDDKGKETYAGVARKHWPKWEGWRIIDQIKTSYGTSASVINRQAKANHNLSRMISDFYKQNFWDTLRLDLFQDQQLADSVYDFGVNSGTNRAAKYLQKAINAYHKPKISEDGQIGPTTLNALHTINPIDLHTTYNNLREDFYRSIAKGNQAQFLRSWLSRLKPYSIVKMAQNKLGLNPDGEYGPQTKQAVINFQKFNGLTPDGIIGPKTISELQNVIV